MALRSSKEQEPLWKGEDFLRYLCQASFAFVPCLNSVNEVEFKTAFAYPALSHKKFSIAPSTLAVIMEGKSARLVDPLKEK